MASKVILIRPDGTTKGFNTIQSAINGAVSGETITIYNNNYTEQITIKDGVNMFCLPGVTITSNNSGGTIIDNGIASRIILAGEPTIMNTGGGNRITLTNPNSDVDESNEFSTFIVSGSLIITGSILVAGDIHISGQLFGTASYAMNAGYNSQNIMYVTSTPNAPNQYATIADAVSAYTIGSTIMLAPETFNEDVVINKDYVKIVGSDKNVSKINSLTISSNEVNVSNLWCSGTFQSLTLSGFNFHAANKISNCRFSGDINIGSATQSNQYGLEFHNSLFDGVYKKITTNNNTSWWRTWMFNCIFNPADLNASSSWSTASYDIDCYNGNLSFNQCPIVNLNSIKFKNYTSGSEIEMNNSYGVIYNIENEITSSDYGVFAFRNGILAFMNPITASNRFELDIERTRLGLNNGGIKWDSIAGSRWINVQQTEWGSTAYITGSGLENLYIMNSTWGMDAPPNLGADIGNVWNGFIDS